ncbi:MAG: hypothetical protein RI958_765 [Actinomycetota bacterium]
MDRRSFVTRAGLGGAAVAAAVGVPVGAFAAGNHRGSERMTGGFRSNVSAGMRRGDITVWWSREQGTDGGERSLALTFDDGPTGLFTPNVLDILARYDVPATFFVIGELVRRRPDDVARMVELGHEVANHTYDHHSAALQTGGEVRSTIERGADAVAAVTGERPRWFRPVRGHVTGAVLQAAAELGHDVALWSVSRDPGVGTPDDDVDGVRRNYIESAHDGALVIFHDGIGRSAFEFTGPDDQLVLQRSTEIAALPAVIETYLAEGYRLTTVSELFDGVRPRTP